MSFYRRPNFGPLAQMGFAPLIAAAMPIVQGALQSHPLNTTNPYAELEQTSGLTIALALGGIVVIGGAFYLVMRSR